MPWPISITTSASCGLASLRDLRERGPHAGARGRRARQRLDLGVAARRFQKLVDLLGPHAEALLVIRLAAQAGDGEVVSRRRAGSAQQRAQSSRASTTQIRFIPHPTCGAAAIPTPRSSSASRNTIGMSHRSFVSRVVMPASE